MILSLLNPSTKWPDFIVWPISLINIYSLSKIYLFPIIHVPFIKNTKGANFSHDIAFVISRSFILGGSRISLAKKKRSEHHVEKRAKADRGKRIGIPMP